MLRLVLFIEYLAIAAFAVFLATAPYGKVISKYAVFSGIAAVFLSRLLKFSGDHKKSLFVFCTAKKTILLFFAACFLSIVVSLDPYHSQKVFMNRYFVFALILLAGFAMGRDFRPGQLFWLLGVFWASGLYMSCGGVYDYIRTYPGDGRLWTVWGHFTSFNALPLYLTAFISFNLVFLLNWMKGFYSWFGLINLIFLLPCFIWQYCQSAFAAITASVLFIGYFKGKRFFSWLLFSIAGGIMVLSFLSAPVRHQMAKYADLNKWDDRMPLYRSAVKIFLDHPVSGAGIGMFEKLVKTDKYGPPPEYMKPYRMYFIHAHSFYLETLAEMGILGVSAFFVGFFVFLRLFVKKIGSQKDMLMRSVLIGLGSSLVVYLVFGVSLSVITVGLNISGVFWLLFGITMGLIKKE